MAAPKKRRAVTLNKNEISEEEKKESVSSDDGSDDGDVEFATQETIQVEFEGRNPTDSDFHGIKQLLNRLFLKAHLNLTELTEVIISQSYVGSVVIQSEPDEEDSDEDNSDGNDVFGITTVINLTEKQNLECVSQLRTLLLESATTYGSEELTELVKKLLSSDDKPVGLLINERFVNIPPQIVVPLLTNLSSEMKRAVKKKMAYDFSYLILISKLYKLKNSEVKKSKKNKKGVAEPEVMWSNPEEEIIDQEAEAKFEFSVEKESDLGVSGQWKSTDSEMTPFRRVLIIPASKLDDIIKKVEEAV